MVVIYTQEETFIRKDADAAKGILEEVYGSKLGAEAYSAVKDGRIGASYRKNGGPLSRLLIRKKLSGSERKKKP